MGDISVSEEDKIFNKLKPHGNERLTLHRENDLFLKVTSMSISERSLTLSPRPFFVRLTIPFSEMAWILGRTVLIYEHPYRGSLDNDSMYLPTDIPT